MRAELCGLACVTKCEKVSKKAIFRVSGQVQGKNDLPNITFNLEITHTTY